MKPKPIPRSKAKTAYGLVSDVIRAIEEEPRRVDMATLRQKVSPQMGGPACGTVGCFAGWVSILAGKMPPKVKTGEIELGVGYGPEETHARLVLGEECDYSDRAIRSSYWDHNDGGYVFEATGKDIRGDVGSREYARSVINRIRRFQKKNATLLRAKKLR
jgi:hypothetical protein